MTDGEHAFDARKHFLNLPDGVPRTEWPTHVLFYSLRSEVLSVPWMSTAPQDRLARINETLRTLEQRGFDSHSMVRFGLGGRLLEAIRTGLSVQEGLRYQAAFSGAVTELPPLPAVWADLLGPGHTAGQRPQRTRDAIPSTAEIVSTFQFEDAFNCDADEIAAVLPIDPHRELKELIAPASLSRLGFVVTRLASAPSRDYMERWLAGATVDELITWSGALPSCVSPSVPAEVLDRYVWLVERMTSTFFGPWTKSSLILERLWSKGRLDSPFPWQEMAHRRIRTSDLDAELAARSEAMSVPAGGGISSMPLGELTRAALVLLEDDQRGLAAELFDVARAAHPTSADVHNNFAFCRLVDDPSAALQVLELAETLGYDSGAINLTNQIQANLMLGRYRRAIFIAELILDQWDQLAPRSTAFLWAQNDTTGPRLMQVVDSRPVALTLAAAAADHLGDTTASQWRKRHDERCLELNVECLCAAAVPA